jgi:hypothetical protein
MLNPRVRLLKPLVWTSNTKLFFIKKKTHMQTKKPHIVKKPTGPALLKQIFGAHETCEAI